MRRFGRSKTKRDPRAHGRVVESRAAALTAAGVPLRDDGDQRQAWPIIADGPGVRIRWTATPRKGYVKYRITDDDDAGRMLFVCTLKDAYAAVMARMPSARRAQRSGSEQFSAQDEADARAAHEGAHVHCATGRG